MSSIGNKVTIDGHEISFGPLSSADVLTLGGIARKEGWGFSDEDMLNFHKLNPEVFTGAYLEDGTLLGK